MKRVIKRDGSVVEFDRNRIINAIRKTFEQASREPNMKLLEKIASQVEDLPDKVLSVEQIQDIVVKKLMKINYTLNDRLFVKNFQYKY